MEEIKLTTLVRRLALDEVGEALSALCEEAIGAACRAYAPYSRFQVGAAALLANGEVITGNNQENAAYPSGLCAERVALFYAAARYPDTPVTVLAIAALQEGKLVEGISPCGGCRQVMAEQERRQGIPMRLLLCGKSGMLSIESARSLLPLTFG